MPTYIDESGDTGTHPHSTPFFRLAAVWFETVAEADEFERAVVALRARLNLRADFEFHFTHLSPALRRAFLEFALGFPFQYAVVSTAKGPDRASVVKEEFIRGTVRGLTQALAEYYLIAEACKPLPNPDAPTPLNELARYDECNVQVYRAVLEREFRAMPSRLKPSGRLVRKIAPFRSQSDPRLQLADVVCGAVGRYLDSDSEYRNLIRRRELAVVELCWNGEGVVPLGTTPSG